MQVRIGGAWVSPKNAKAFISGAWRTLIRGKAYVSGAWRDCATFVQPMSVALSGTMRSNTQTCGPLTATPTGGLGPFSYAYSVTSPPSLVTVASPTSATSYFYSSTTRQFAASILCTVTDSLGTVATASANIVFNYDPSLGGPL